MLIRGKEIVTNQHVKKAGIPPLRVRDYSVGISWAFAGALGCFVEMVTPRDQEWESTSCPSGLQVCRDFEVESAYVTITSQKTLAGVRVN